MSVLYKHLMAASVFVCQPRPVAGFRGTVRYASVNAHKNKVSICLLCAKAAAVIVMKIQCLFVSSTPQLSLYYHDKQIYSC